MPAALVLTIPRLLVRRGDGGNLCKGVMPHAAMQVKAPISETRLRAEKESLCSTR